MTNKSVTRGEALAKRLNKETILEKMPKIYFVEDSYNGGYRVGRTDWAGDWFIIVSKADFDMFLTIYKGLNMPIIDLTHDDDGSEWNKVRTP